MPKLTRDVIKKSVLAAGYKWWDDKPMIVGIRTTIDIPDAFNDILTLSMPDGSFVGLTATTDPGLYYLQNPMNVNGTGILVHGQYIDSHILDYHGKGLRRHRAWRQCGNLNVYRDNNKDSVLDRNTKNIVVAGPGACINIHAAVALDKIKNIPLLNWMAPKIWNWSAACQVAAMYGAFKSKFTDVCDLWEKINKKVGIKYTYTLLLENQLTY